MYVFIPKPPKTRRGAVITLPLLRQFSVLRSSAPGLWEAAAHAPGKPGTEHRKRADKEKPGTA